MKEKIEAQSVEIKDTDSNDYKELFGNLRNAIGSSKDQYKLSLQQTVETIEKREDELRILKIRKHKLEGAIEASESFLTAVLPSNSKK